MNDAIDINSSLCGVTTNDRNGHNIAQHNITWFKCTQAYYLIASMSSTINEAYVYKKAVLSQENRAMPQLFFSV